MRTHAQARKAASGLLRAPLTAGNSPGPLTTQTRVQQIVGGPRVQAKLVVDPPDDVYEREADRVADAVMRMPAAEAEGSVAEAGALPRIQRPCSDCEAETKVQRACSEEEIRCKSVDEGYLEARIRSLSGRGEPLPAAAKAFFEPRFGQDFSRVRIHTGDSASETTNSLRARAFTAGNHIVFGGGQYQPAAAEGKRLLAHELTHVVQQGNEGAGFDTPRLQAIGPSSTVKAYEAFTEPQRSFLQATGIDPAGLTPTVAHRLAELLSAVEQAVQTGDPPHIGPQIGDMGAEMTLSLTIEQGSIIISRRLDLATGTLQLQLSYQDADGNRIETTTTQGPPRVLSLHSLAEVQPPILNLPLLELGKPRLLEESSLPYDPEAFLPREELEDVSDLFPPESDSPDGSDLLPLESDAPGSSEGVGSFLEGAVLGDFGENDSWSAIAGQTVVGFIPIVGQIADVRDLMAAFKGVAEGREGGWLNVGIAAIAFVPGLDWLKGGKRVGKKVAKESAEVIAEGSEAALKGGSGVPKKPKIRLSTRELLARRFGDRLQGDGLEEVLRRTSNETVAVQRRAAAMELRTMIRYLEKGAPDGRKISKLEVIPSASGASTPDFVVHFPDGTQQRVEVTTLTAAPKGLTPKGKELAAETLARSSVSVSDVANAIGRKAKGKQLTAPLSGVPSGGAIIVHVMGGRFNAEMASAAVKRAEQLGKLGPHVDRVEISFMERGVDQKLNQVTQVFRRSSSGEYVPMPLAPN